VANRGLWFEELQPGRTFETGSRVIDDAAIEAFALVSGDDNPLHLDEAYARTTALGGRVAHGLLGPAVVSGLMAELGLTRGTLIALVGVSFEFVRPIRPGTEVRARIQVSGARPTSKPGRGLVVFAVELVDASDRLLQRGEFRELVRSRGESPSG
jgi:3-hydroxybutyryl-CoA dehydratase